MISQIVHITISVFTVMLFGVRLLQLVAVACRGLNTENVSRMATDKPKVLNADLGLVVLATIIVALGFGWLWIVLYCKVVPVATLWALACVGSGFLTGFLFGFPKVFQGKPAVDKDGKPLPDQPYSLQVNNNLSEISDWLCKIIVGVGLIQLSEVPGKVTQLAEGLAGSIGDQMTARAFAGGLIVYFLVVGFLAGYLITRLYLTKLFGQADRDAIAGAAQKIAEEIDEKLKQQVETIDIDLAVAIGKIAQNLQTRDDLLMAYAVGRLEEVRARHPEHRRAAIVLGNLFKLKTEFKKALDVLDHALKAKAYCGTGTDKDAQDMHFNRACYYYLLREAAPDAAKPPFNDKLYQALDLAFKGRPDNIEEAKTDDELKLIQLEPRYVELVARLTAAAAAP